LGPYLSEIVPVLERLDELEINEEVRKKLLEISPATIDRLLAPVRKRYQLKARSNTKPGTLLKHQIPIRTFSDWDEKRPGFVEIDLVSHGGGDPSGDFAQTLDMTDICTAWTDHLHQVVQETFTPGLPNMPSTHQEPCGKTAGYAITKAVAVPPLASCLAP